MTTTLRDLIARAEAANAEALALLDRINAEDDLADAAFHPETVDYAAIVAERLYPVDIVDGVDVNGQARAAYARGYADALAANLPPIPPAR